MVNNLYLDGQPVGDNSVAVANGNGRDILWMRGFDLTDGFTLTGQSVMYWTDEFEPSQSRLAYQIKLGHALHQDEYWANPFMNDEYADVTVYKEIDGEQSDRDFNFRIYEGTGTGGAIVAQTSVDINNPEFIGGLVPGTYTIAEQPVEGYITPQPYTFKIDSGESLDITLRNIEIVPQPEPSMIIEKVADDYSVYVGEDVTYTITVTNTGEVDLDYVYVSDVVDANIRAMKKGDGLEINIGTSRGTSVNQLFYYLKKFIGYSKEPIYGPPRKGDIRTSLLCYTRAKEELRWEPKVDLEKGLKLTIEWFKRNFKTKDV